MATAISEAPAPARHDFERIRFWIRIWLWGIATFIGVLILVGGTTRMMEAGLSITEWQLVTGIFPPLSDTAWQQEFAKYQQIPEFQLNSSMTLEQFQEIYWMEYTHRLLARLLGLAVIVPLVFLWVTGRLDRYVLPRLLVIAGLIVFQGIVGWWMVQSGLAATDVNPLWLTFHLMLAFLTLAYVTTVAMSLTISGKSEATPGYRWMGGLIVVVAFVQVFYGGLMAGTNAGLTFNTWPMMDGELIPTRLLFDGFQLSNLYADIATIQFMHRVTAYVLTFLVFVHLIQTWRSEFAAPVFALLWLIVAQIGLGILTLILSVPMGLALLHQFGAVLLVFTAVANWRAMWAPLPLPEPARPGA